jgi:hypothetical protein
MGGFGSGRHGGTVTAEGTASYVLSIKSLLPTFQMGQCLTRGIKFDGTFPVLLTVDLRNEWNCFVELIHLTRDAREGDRMVTGRVQLTRTEPTYGGRRWWFLCPRTGRRTPKLFLPNGGWHFRSRQAYGLGYACQREERADRLRRRAAKLNRQLGGEGWDTWETPPDKPKWMRWRTHETKLKVWEEAVEKANTELIARAMMGLKRR